MKKFFVNILAFIPVAAIGYAIFLCIWGEVFFRNKPQNLMFTRAGYGHTLSRLSDAKNVNTNQVLFLGSSLAYRGFDVRYMFQRKIHAFNLGSSAQTPMQTEMLLHRYLESINPKLVVFEVAPNLFTVDGVESSIDIFSNDTNDLLSIKMALKLNDLRSYNTLIFSTYRDLFNRNKGIVEQKVKSIDTYRKNGFVERKLAHFKYRSFPKKTLKFREDQMEALKRIVDKLKERGIPYYLIQAPITKGMYDRYTNIEEYEEFVKPLGPYLNFNEIMKLDDSLHYYDAMHLNQVGVELFNDKLIDTLKLDTRWK